MGKTDSSKHACSVRSRTHTAEKTAAGGREKNPPRPSHKRKCAHGVRRYRSCRAYVRSEENKVQKEAPATDTLKKSSRRSAPGMNGKQAALVFVVVMVVLAMVSEFSRTNTGTSVENKAELIKGVKK